MSPVTISEKFLSILKKSNVAYLRKGLVALSNSRVNGPKGVGWPEYDLLVDVFLFWSYEA